LHLTNRFHVIDYLKNTETVAETGRILVCGDITSNAVVDYQRVVRDAIKSDGYHDSKGLILLDFMINA
jgi:S-adenosylmethionine synthetase